MIESQQPREEPEGWSSLRDEGEELQEEQQQQRRPAAGPAASSPGADTARPLPSHLGQIHHGLGRDAVSGHENIVL